MYEDGKGTPKDYNQAIKWYLQPAEQGDAWAQYNLGGMYENGEGIIAQDYQKAIKWYQKAAWQGHVGAKCRLADMYDNG